MLGERRDLERFAECHTCLDCGPSQLVVVRWSGKANSHEVYCPRCGNTERFAKPRSLTAMWREDPESVPVTVANRLEAKYGGVGMSDRQIIVATERQMTERIDKARWLKELNPDDRTTLARLAVQYGLDPIMGDLSLYEGKPYITLGGMLRVAHRQSEFAGIDDRPMTPEERTAYGIKQPVVWIALIYRRGWQVPTKGIGTADPMNPRRNNPIERSEPHVMARSRAIRQALRTAFPHSLPWTEIRTAGQEGEEVDADARVIDADTGEVTPSNGHQAVPAEGQSAPEQDVPAEEPAPNPTQLYEDYKRALAEAANLSALRDTWEMAYTDRGKLAPAWMKVLTETKDKRKAELSGEPVAAKAF